MLKMSLIRPFVIGTVRPSSKTVALPVDAVPPTLIVALTGAPEDLPFMSTSQRRTAQTAWSHWSDLSRFNKKNDQAAGF